MEPHNEENLAEMKLTTLTWPGCSHTARKRKETQLYQSKKEYL